MIRELFKQCGCARKEWPRCKHPFHYRKQVGGKRWCISLDAWLGHERTRSVDDAEHAAAALFAELRAGTFSPLGPRANGQMHNPVTGQVTRFTEVAERYQDLVDADPERKPDYRAGLRSMIRLVTGWRIPDRPETLGALPIGAIDNPLLERFYRAQVAAGKSVSYRNKMIQFLRAFSRWAVRQGYLATAWLEPADAGVTIKRRKGAQRDRRLALAEVDADGRELVASEFDRLCAVAEPRLRDLCVATFESGARLAELTRLRWRAVDLARGLLTIWDTKDPDGVKKRVIPISETLRAVLLARRHGPDDVPHAPDACVFGNVVGEPVGSIATAWQNAVLRLGGYAIARDATTHGLTAAARRAYRALDLVFHDLRHEAASQWLESGAFDLPTISFLLGHTSLTTTQIYLNVRPEGLAEKMAAFARQRRSGVQVAYASTAAPARGPKLVKGNSRKSRKIKD